LSETGDRLAAQSRWLQLLCFHLAGRKIRARVEGEDLVQETFARLLASGRELPAEEPGEVPLRQALARTARHVVLDLARSLRRRKRSAPEVPLTRSDWSRSGVGADDVLVRSAGPATRAGDAEELQRVLAAFAGLPAEYRRVIGLRQFEGLSAAETARRMRRSESAIHSLYRRALEAWGGR
jgi:RNA polymerase sigma-70 factor (ECF subfamily)